VTFPLTGPKPTRRPKRHSFRRGLRTAAFVAFALAACCVVSYCLDGEKLRRIAEHAAPSGELPSRRVLALADWVYHHEGFRENDRYFVLPRLRATPAQVLAGGGDCADKSRLLTALLREIGIASTMVMCFDRRSGAPTHTVVEAQIENGSYMVVDPVYRLWFPRPHGQGYFHLLDLRNDPTILERRLDDLLVVAPRRSPLRSYNPESAVYDHAASINWDKNVVTRLLYDRLHVRYGNDVYRLPRPVILEEPKLFVAAALTGLGCVCVASTVIVRGSKSRRESPTELRSKFACGL